MARPSSHPTRVRGLKQFNLQYVASNLVAPHTGAWIETLDLASSSSTAWSHPTRVRGLKLL